ncbi:hypothetical protein ACHAXT_007466 [Thalassiosira profunda]
MSSAPAIAAPSEGDPASPVKPKKMAARSSSTLTSHTSCTYVGDSSSDDELSDGSHRLNAPGEARGGAKVEVYFSKEHVQRANRAAAAENERLNLHLGLPVDLTVLTRRDGGFATTALQKLLRLPIRAAICLVDRFLSIIETPLFQFYSERLPLRWRQRITFLAWGMYLPVHKALIGRRSGLHRDVSLEYHALTSVMWWGRLFPVTVKRMRMSLSQLHVCHPPEQYPQWKSIANSPDDDLKPSNGERYGIRGHLYEVYHRMDRKRTPTGFGSSTEEQLSAADMTVTGQYIQQGAQPSQKVLFWIYGGAFLAGDSMGNLGIAEKMGMCTDGDSGMRDVFIPDYRLVPEYHLDDAIHDITLAYEYLICERGVRPEDVVLVGISSGGGLVALLMQALARARRNFNKQRDGNGSDDSDGSDCVPMPAGGVLIGPFVDYTEPKGSMKEFVKHDLIVNQSVYDEGIPFLEQVLGSHDSRVRASPVYGDFDGLPPLCICVSRHEVVYDQSMLLAERAREQGVDVTVGVWKYMCHVFPLLCPFLPEGRESFDFMCEWIKER